jgi:hypothetical protein
LVRWPRPTRSPATAQPATRTVKLISAELRRIRILATRPDLPGYKRDQFGQTWTDDHSGSGGHNGCDTRSDVLAVQLTAVQYRSRSRCVIIAGTVPADPYTGRRIEFRKADAAKVQIDHVYPLARAWDMGAARWPLQRRVDFANDQTANLLGRRIGERQQERRRARQVDADQPQLPVRLRPAVSPGRPQVHAADHGS